MIHEKAHFFLDDLLARTRAYENILASLSMDHICYRTQTMTEYEKAKSEFLGQGKILIESLIGNRPIATFKLYQPIIYNDYFIDLIELAAPKPSKLTKQGVEHAEFIITNPLNWIKEYFPAEIVREKDDLKVLNPEIEVNFNDLNIKFHHKSLEDVIAIESNPLVMRILDKSQVLEKLSEFNPLLSGTIPLKVDVLNSDIDILCEHQDLDYFEHKVRSHFEHSEKFSTRRAKHQGLESSVISFAINGLMIELFAQNKSVYKQAANLHFVAESKLLKVVGERLRSDVKRLKSEGVKTEPAFGKLLGLSDPYEELITMAHQSDGLLYKRFMNYSS